MPSTPSISQRKHYREPPSSPTEPTSTIVLSSHKSYYIDIRILKSLHQAESSKDLSKTHNSPDILQWAFAGTSSSTSTSGPEGSRHTVWKHWIDSKSLEPGKGGKARGEGWSEGETDEGTMSPLPDGDVLEKGSTRDPDTGKETAYEELWTELPVDVIPEEGGKYSTVLRAQTAAARGMVVRVGGWCQGLLIESEKGNGEEGEGGRGKGKKMTVERWRWMSEENDPTQGPGYWKRVVRIGEGEMPGPVMLRGVGDGKDTEVVNGELKWEVVENYRWV